MVSLLVVCGMFTCSMWNLVPCPGIEPRLPALGVRSLSHWTAREVPGFLVYVTLWNLHIVNVFLSGDKAMEESHLPHPSFIIFAPLITLSFPLTCSLFFYYVLSTISQISF